MSSDYVVPDGYVPVTISQASRLHDLFPEIPSVAHFVSCVYTRSFLDFIGQIAVYVGLDPDMTDPAFLYSELIRIATFTKHYCRQFFSQEMKVLLFFNEALVCSDDVLYECQMYRVPRLFADGHDMSGLVMNKDMPRSEFIPTLSVLFNDWLASAATYVK